MSTNPYTDRSKTTIYVWEPDFGSTVLTLLSDTMRRKSPSDKEVGHVSMDVEGLYISVYPSPESITNSPQLNPHMSFSQERLENPDRKVHSWSVTWLNTDVILAKWADMKSHPYNIAWSSCSGICSNLLIAGAQLSFAASKEFPEYYERLKQLDEISRSGKDDSIEVAIKSFQSIPVQETFYGELKKQYLLSNPAKIIKGIGISFRRKLSTVFHPQRETIDLFTTPMDITEIAEALLYYEQGKYMHSEERAEIQKSREAMMALIFRR